MNSSLMYSLVCAPYHTCAAGRCSAARSCRRPLRELRAGPREGSRVSRGGEAAGWEQGGVLLISRSVGGPGGSGVVGGRGEQKTENQGGPAPECRQT
eukprot:4317456-Prymnesium_polylepis.1